MKDMPVWRWTNERNEGVWHLFVFGPLSFFILLWESRDSLEDTSGQIMCYYFASIRPLKSIHCIINNSLLRCLSVIMHTIYGTFQDLFASKTIESSGFLILDRVSEDLTKLDTIRSTWSCFDILDLSDTMVRPDSHRWSFSTDIHPITF